MTESLSSPFFSELLAYFHSDAVRQLLAEKNPYHIEADLLKAFAPREYGVKVYRGLPRVYHRDQPTRSHVKPEFSHLPSLKQLVVERFIFPLYKQMPIRPCARVTLFTWVLS